MNYLITWLWPSEWDEETFTERWWGVDWTYDKGDSKTGSYLYFRILGLEVSLYKAYAKSN